MKELNKKGFTLVEILIVVAIIALLAAVAIPNLLRAKMTANDSATLGNLKGLSTASEMFAVANAGTYPASINSLTGLLPPYISKNLCLTTLSGFGYDCSGMTPAGYTILATPLTAGSTGTTIYTVTTGGVLTPVK